MTQYRYIDAAGAVKGPVTSDELAKLRSANEVTDATRIQEGPDGEWIKFSEIFPAETDAPKPESEVAKADPTGNEAERYFVWTREKPGVLGPLTVSQIQVKLESQIIRRELLATRDVGQGAKAARTTKNAETVGDLVDGEIPITRRSGWSTLSLVLAAISAAGSFLGLVTLLFGNPGGLVIFFGGAGQCVGFLFLAFMINVLTDIRWFLSKLVAETRKS